MQQKLVKFFYEAGAFGNNIGKDRQPQKPRPKLKNVYICSGRNPMQVVVFCKHILICRKTTQTFSL